MPLEMHTTRITDLPHSGQDGVSAALGGVLGELRGGTGNGAQSGVTEKGGSEFQCYVM